MDGRARESGDWAAGFHRRVGFLFYTVAIVRPVPSRATGLERLNLGADAMIEEFTQTAVGAVLTGIEPQFFVADVKRACDFYTEKLGFAVAFVYGDPPFYGQVFRDAARINLRLVGEPVFAGDVRRREGLLSASITVATAGEIEELFASYQAAGVSFQQVLKTEPWGARTFVVSDLDGNLFLFAGAAGDK